MRTCSLLASSALLIDVLVVAPNGCDCFQSTSSSFPCMYTLHQNAKKSWRMPFLHAAQGEKEGSSGAKLVDMANVDSEKDEEQYDAAATNTINERLMQELEDVKNQEYGGSKSSVGKKLGFDAFRSDKTKEEREAAIAEARDLNGVNPSVALAGSAFALAAAAGLWALTNFLAEYFVLHPVESDTFVVERVSAVMRNVVMGIVALASGFFGVTGLGIFLLGVRVAYGVATDELDPTPIKKSRQEEIELPNVWDLMMNKKPGRRR